MSNVVPDFFKIEITLDNYKKSLESPPYCLFQFAIQDKFDVSNVISFFTYVRINDKLYYHNGAYFLYCDSLKMIEILSVEPITIYLWAEK